MKNLKSILLEKLIINKNTKVKKELSESEIDDLIQKCDGIISSLNSDKKIHLSNLVSKHNFY